GRCNSPAETRPVPLGCWDWAQPRSIIKLSATKCFKKRSRREVYLVYRFRFFFLRRDQLLIGNDQHTLVEQVGINQGLHQIVSRQRKRYVYKKTDVIGRAMRNLETRRLRDDQRLL